MPPCHQMHIISLNKMSSADRTSVYDKHLNEKRSLTLVKLYVSFRLRSATDPAGGARAALPDNVVAWGLGNFIDTQMLWFLPRCMKCRRGLTMRILSVRPSVCLSVCLSVKLVNCDKTEEKSVQILCRAKDNLA